MIKQAFITYFVFLLMGFIVNALTFVGLIAVAAIFGG